MSYPLSTNGNGHEPCVGFDYSTLDSESDVPLTVDEAFWKAQGELLADILRWLSVPQKLSGIGARCLTLILYLRPEMIQQSSLREICAMEDAPRFATLSKAMLQFQMNYKLQTGYYQKPVWMRDRYRRSAILAHAAQKELDTMDELHAECEEYERLVETD